MRYRNYRRSNRRFCTCCEPHYGERIAGRQRDRSLSPTVGLQGKLDTSVKTIRLRSQMALSTYTGPGEVLLAPHMLGDITSFQLSGDEVWSVAKDAYLACTQGVARDFKRQGLGKAFFSGDGLFVFKVSGSGIMWITSFGALVRKDLAEGEKYFVDNGHLVAWNTKYILQRASSRGYISGISAGEGLVCKFTGPGTVFFQTRNPVSRA
ncbi:TRAP-like protein [Hyaloscypha variabilis F]|uniref:Altered inheritance of mitochondria protein 24, mitochondrial n=1 Tax=Hyaloscypha variabilis (strain UAMH 11265 / GT02V1 / F) TaxID=1149755 RepID=A0A2J6QS94_HYAVF|nr:TRAP-like protein [Hyaloscypha variabilis F]